MITDLLARKYRFNVPGTKGKLKLDTANSALDYQATSTVPKDRKRMRLINELLVKTERA